VKAGEMDNFFMFFSGFTDLIDGIILNMKFGGWMISGFSLLVEDLLLISCFCKGTHKPDRIQNL
jgi:hypothetical protein